MGGMLSDLTGTKNTYQAAQAPIAQQDFTGALSGSANQFNDIFNQQTGLAGQLQQQALGQGPNPAQIQLQQATNQNISQNAGMLASQRGLSPALAQRLAAQNAASTNQQSAGQASLMGAQQQLAARGQLAGVLGQQQQGALGMNQNLQNAQAQQNNAIVGNTSSINSANAATAMGNQQNSAGLLGGALGGLGSAFGLAHGGMVPPPQHFAGGGPVSAIGQFLGGGSSNPYGGFSAFGKGLHDLFSKPATPGSTEDYQQYSGSGFSPEQMSLEHARADAVSAGGLPPEAMQDQPAPAPDQLPQAGGPGVYAPVVGDPFAGIGPSYQVGQQNPDFMASGGMAALKEKYACGGMTGLKMAMGGDPSGQVGGQAQVSGNSLQNDKVPAMLSPREIVLPRSITMHPNAPALAAEFVRRELHKHHADSKKNFSEGGVVDSIQKWMAPDFHKAEQQKKSQQLPPPIYKADGGEIPQGLDPSAQGQMVNTGFDPNAQFIVDPRNTAARRAFDTYKSNVQLSDPFASDEQATDAAIQSVDAEKQFNLSRQQNQMQSQQAAHDEAVVRNSRLQELGLPTGEIPQAPVNNPILQANDQAQGMPSAMNSMDQMSAQNPMAQMDKTMMGAYTKAASEQKAGFNQAATAQEQLGQANAKIANDQSQREQGLMKDYQQQNSQLMGEYDAAMKDYASGHINPNHYAESMSSVGKVKTAIGLVLGGMGGGLLHQENPALKFLNSQIDRDIDAQKSELGKKQNLLQANIHKMGNLRDATEMTRAMMMGIQANQFRAAAANAQGPMARATAMQEAGKLDERIAPIMSQIAMRQTMMRGMGTGQVDPTMAIRFMAPEGQQMELMKQYASAQSMSKQKDNLLNAFDQVNKIANVQSHLASPLQTSRQADALTEPLLAQLIKDSEGRITPQDTEMMKGLFPRVGDSDSTRRLRRIQLNKFITEKMNFPALAPYGYNPSAGGRYNAQGMDRLPPMAPPKR